MRDGRLIAVLLFVVGIAACGGGGKKTTNEPTGDDVATGDDDSGGGGDDVMVPPEKMEEINVRLDRKRPTAARCLSDAVQSGDAPKNARGKITLEFVISPAGRAEQIKVTKASFENEKVTNCVISKVQDISFPELPRALDWSYTFAFESIN